MKEKMTTLDLDNFEKEQEDNIEITVTQDETSEEDDSNDENLGNTEVVVEDNSTEEKTESEEEVSKDDKEKVAEEDKESKKSSRAQDRIRQVIAERNKEREEKAQLVKELADLKKKQIESSKSTAEIQKTLLKQNMDSLKSRIKKAHEDSDTDSLIELQLKMNETQLRLTALEQWEPEEDTAEESVKEAATVKKDTIEAPKLADAPEALQNWVKDNSWFQKPQSQKDRALIMAAVAMHDLMVAEGHDPEDDDFYELLDKKIGNKVASNTENDVQSKKKSSDDKTLIRKKPISQTVQGASRTPPNSASARRISLSPQQVKTAELYGMTHLEYAKELMKIEKSKKSGQKMTSLFE